MRIDPFRDLRDPFSLLGVVTRPAPLLADVYRQNDAYLIRMDAPGVDPEAIEVSVQRNVISVSVRREASSLDGVEVLLTERPNGQATRTISLGEEIDAAAVQADYSSGVLSLHLPIAEASRPRKVPVTRVGLSQPPAVLSETA